MLEVKDICMSYANKRNEVFNLLNGVNFTIAEGEITALIGGNGTGKTTLFNIISGFERHYSGRVEYRGRDISHLPPHRIARMSNDDGIGRLFQGRQLMGSLTLLENMKLASFDGTGESPFGSIFNSRRIRMAEKQKEQQAVEILKRIFGQDNKYLDMLHQKASQLSYGEQRLIAMARLLMGNYHLLLLDEPTSGVNNVYIETIKQIINDMVEQEGRTVLIIEHNMPFVRDISQNCLFLADGRIARKGSPTDVLSDSEVLKNYLVE